MEEGERKGEEEGEGEGEEGVRGKGRLVVTHIITYNVRICKYASTSSSHRVYTKTHRQ